MKSPIWCFPVVELQPANVRLGTAHLLKEKVFVTGLPPCQQGNEPAQAGNFSKLKDIFFLCEDLPRLAESFSSNSSKEKPCLPFVLLKVCETQERKSNHGMKLGLRLLKVYMC